VREIEFIKVLTVDYEMAPSWRQAASVLIFHHTPSADEGQCDYKICLVKRSPASRVFPTSLVFPGGALEPSDRYTVNTLDQSRMVINDMALRICAIREVMEETGILLSEPAQVVDNIEQLSGISEISDLNRLTCLQSVSCWISPLEIANGAKGGFETHFYAALLDKDFPIHSASPDGVETTEIQWLSPSEALSAEVRFKLPMPQLYMISEVSECLRFSDLDKFLKTLRQGIFRYPFKPLKLALASNSLAFILPGDKEHPEYKPINGQPWEHRGVYAAHEAREPSWVLIRSPELRDEARKASNHNEEWCRHVIKSNMCLDYIDFIQ
jgi:8-oxo-dGTP pyrophosphatase MutT (NUDIX family)